MKTNKLLQLLKDNARAEARPGVLRAEVADDGAHRMTWDVLVALAHAISSEVAEQNPTG